jgi:hypothetical protein
MATFWLTFADPNKPVGSKFLGVIIVEAGDLDAAIARTEAAGINPGGEITAEDISDLPPPREWFDRLLSDKEARDVNRVMCKQRRAMEDDEDY